MSLEQPEKTRNARTRLVTCGIGFFILLFLAYGVAYCTGWKLSFTNVDYSFVPFGSTGVRTKGPLLTDVADNILPIAYSVFHPLTFTGWLPSFGIGSPQGFDLYLSPLNYFYMLPLSVAQPLISMVKVIVALIGMYFFMRQLGYTWRGSFIAGMSYSMCSVMIMWNGWQHSTVTMYAPLLFLLLDKLLTKLSVKYYVALAAVIYLMLVAGMPTYAAYFLYLSGAYMLFYGVRTYHGRPADLAWYIFWFVVSVGIAGLMSLPYTGSLVSTVVDNGYTQSREAYGTQVLDPANLKSLFFPYLSSSSTMHLNESTLYTGVLAVVSLPLTAVGFRSKKRAGFFSVSAGILLILIFTHAGDAIFSLLPLVHTSMKYRVLVLLNFSLAVLVGINMDKLLNATVIDRKQRFMILGLLALTLLAFAGLVIRVLPTRAFSTDSGVNQFYVACVVVALYSIVVVAKVFSPKGLVSVLCTVAMVCGVAVDMGYFASQYMPLISKDAPVIPKATSSVAYLQKGTSDGQKIATTGDWNFFPMSNVYYGISSIEGHGFVYTNNDMSNYFEGIDSSAFDNSSTRPTITSLDNTNLLKYMGVKYLVGDPSAYGDRSPDTSQMTPSVNVNGDKDYSLDLTATRNGLSSIGVYAGLYGQTRSAGTATLTVSDEASGAVVATDTLQLKDLDDNSEVFFTFAPIKNSAHGNYKVNLSVDDPTGKGIALYTCSKVSAQISKLQSSNLAMDCVYGDVRMGEDDLAIKQLYQYSPLVQLINNIEVDKSDDDVLQSMKQNYRENTVHFSKESGSPLSKSVQEKDVSKSEKIGHVTVQRNGTVDFSVTADQKRFVLVNQYNDGNWVAYVDGRKTPVYAGNYLFRAVQVPKGTHTVSLRYEPTDLKPLFIAAAGAAVMLVLLLCLSKPLDRALFSGGRKNSRRAI